MSNKRLKPATTTNQSTIPAPVEPHAHRSPSNMQAPIAPDRAIPSVDKAMNMKPKRRGRITCQSCPSINSMPTYRTMIGIRNAHFPAASLRAYETCIPAAPADPTGPRNST